MDKSFRECFAELCADRASDAIVSAQQGDAEYVAVLDRLNDIRGQVEEIIGRELLIKLADAYIRKQTLDIHAAYEQGMRDGLRLNSIVGGVA